MTTQTATKLITAEEFYDFVHLPENANHWFELVQGEVIELPPPVRIHGLICTRVGRYLDEYAEKRGSGYAAGNDSGVILERDPDTVRGPDVAFYEDAASSAEVHPKYGEVPPLLAVEVISPNDKAWKVMLKLIDYLKAGVKLVWVIDPESREVIVHRPEKAPQRFKSTDEITGGDVLPGFRCRVSDFFRLPGEKPKE